MWTSLRSRQLTAGLLGAFLGAWLAVALAPALAAAPGSTGAARCPEGCRDKAPLGCPEGGGCATAEATDCEGGTPGPGARPSAQPACSAESRRVAAANWLPDVCGGRHLSSPRVPSPVLENRILLI